MKIVQHILHIFGETRTKGEPSPFFINISRPRLTALVVVFVVLYSHSTRKELGRSKYLLQQHLPFPFLIENLDAGPLPLRRFWVSASTN